MSALVTAATPVSLTPLQAAYARFCLAVHANAPRDLRVLNSPLALSGRICDFDALMLACRDLGVAIIEDTAPHLNVDPAPLVRQFDAQMHDAAGDVRGPLVDAVHARAA